MSTAACKASNAVRAWRLTELLQLPLLPLACAISVCGLSAVSSSSLQRRVQRADGSPVQHSTSLLLSLRSRSLRQPLQKFGGALAHSNGV